MPTPLVLLIEDDSRLSDTISDLLELIGIEYRVTRNDTFSRTSLVTLKPDLILLDMPLRGCSSIDLLMEINVDLRLWQTKLVVIAADEYAEAPECRIADVVLAKPFAVGELECVLRRLLGHHPTADMIPRSKAFAFQSSSASG